MPEATLIVRGAIPSKKNMYKAGRSRVYLPTAVKDQLRFIEYQIRRQWGNREPLEHPDIAVEFMVHSRRVDRDNMVTSLIDSLRRAGVLKNDNIASFNGWITIAPARVHDHGPEADKTTIRLRINSEGSE